MADPSEIDQSRLKLTSGDLASGDPASGDPASENLVSGLELWQWRQDAQQSAIVAGIPVQEVDWLLQEVAPLDRLTLRLESFKDRTQIALTLPFPHLQHLWQQRLERRVPVQYLVGVAPWRQFSLRVSPSVLIPRPETEELIELAVTAARPFPKFMTGHWVDLGTGSGAIAIGLAHALPQATIHAVEVSQEALEVAHYNAQHLVGDRIQFHQGQWFEPLAYLRGQLCGMVSNPPYIPHDLIAELQPEVAQHEPHLALDGGADGLDCIRQLVDQAPNYLVSGGIWLIEMMAGQGEAVVNLLQAQGQYREIGIHHDLAGLDRFVLAYRV